VIWCPRGSRLQGSAGHAIDAAPAAGQVRGRSRRCRPAPGPRGGCYAGGQPSALGGVGGRGGGGRHRGSVVCAASAGSSTKEWCLLISNLSKQIMISSVLLLPIDALKSCSVRWYHLCYMLSKRHYFITSYVLNFCKGWEFRFFQTSFPLFSVVKLASCYFYCGSVSVEWRSKSMYQVAFRLLYWSIGYHSAYGFFVRWIY
jgi:hypothetical protein